MEESLSSSCFICGGASFNRSGPRRGRRPNNFKSLKELVRRLCDLLEVVEVTEEDWEELEEQNVRLICCEKCVEILRNVDRLQEIILKTQMELKVYLDQVQSMIVQSESESQRSLICSLWWRGCLNLRRNVLKKFVPTLSVSTTGHHSNSHLFDSGDPAEIYVKEETEDNDHLLNDDWDPIQVNDLGNPEDNFIANASKLWDGEAGFASTITTSNLFEKSEEPGQRECNFVLPQTKRKRKITVIAEDDIPEKSPKVERVGSSRSRAAKISAEEALKVQYESHGASDDDGDADDDHQNESNDSTYLLDNPNHQSEASADEDGVASDASIPNSKKDKCNDKVKNKYKKNMTKVQMLDQPDSTAPFGRTCCGVIRKNPKKHPFFPFVVAKEDLFLYRFDTFVTKTYTHIYCQAYKCDFFTEFDYYSSFQTMKAHLDKCHRSWTHRQKKPHPCLLCNILLKNREELWNHCKAHHNDEFFKSPKSICECCLTTKPSITLRLHLFTHKNAEEKAKALELNDAPAKCFKPKEKDITERKFVCTFENCTKKFKNHSNWRRHKQLHLPLELRTNRTLCPECGKNVLTEDFRVHMEKFHHPETVNRVLICKYCDKRYHTDDKQVYEAHLRRHKGEKPFLCTQCGKSYYDSGNLNAHIKTAHGKLEPLPCQWCDKVYTLSQSLRSHIKYHHPDKLKPTQSVKERTSKFYYKEEVRGDFIGPIQKYPCEICGTICGYLQTLKRHMARAHGIGDASVKYPLGPYGPRKKKKDEAEGRHGDDPNNREDEDDGSKDEDANFYGIGGTSMLS